MSVKNFQSSFCRHEFFTRAVWSQVAKYERVRFVFLLKYSVCDKSAAASVKERTRYHRGHQFQVHLFPDLDTTLNFSQKIIQTCLKNIKCSFFQRFLTNFLHVFQSKTKMKSQFQNMIHYIDKLNLRYLVVVVVERFNSKNLTAIADLCFFTTYTKSNQTCKYKSNYRY